MKRLRRAGQYGLGLVLFLAVWWGGSRIVGPRVLPEPRAVARYIVSPGLVTEFFVETSRTIARGALGFFSAWVVALPSGFVMGRRQPARRVGFFPLFLLQSAPPLFWITPLVLWLGTNGSVAPAVAFLVSLPLLTVHTFTAIRNIPGYEYDLFSIYAPQRRVIARELYLPRLLPALKSNVHLGLLVAIKVAMLAEWFAAQNGFGRTIRIHYQFFAMTEFLSWALLFLLLVGGLSLGIQAALDRFLPQYRPSGSIVPDSGAHRDARPRTLGPARIPTEDRIAALSVDEIEFGYEDKALFSGLSFRLEPGKPLVLSGRSGCGKTTLLKCAAGLLKPWTGSVSRPDTVGFVFQEDALLAHRDALGNVLLPSMPHPSLDAIADARDSLLLWGLADSAHLFPHELSGGMRKRLAIARAWHLGGRVILLDEPFINLDREARSALWEHLFFRLAEDKVAALIVTHYPEELAAYKAERFTWGDLVGTGHALTG